MGIEPRAESRLFMDKVRVFLSYAPEDQAVASAACGTLEARGIACWMASRDLPVSDPEESETILWSEDIVAAIEGSRVMVLVFSSSSNISLQVKRQIELAVAHNLVIVPFRIEDVPLSKSMEYFISMTHWLDAMTEPLEPHLDYLAKTVEVLIADAESARHSSLIVQRRSGTSLPGMERVGEPKGSAPKANETLPAACPVQALWDEVEVRQVETALAAYLGPLAKMLVKQEQKTARDIQELCQSVARHIGRPDEKARFLQRCEAALKSRVASPQTPKALSFDTAKVQGLFAKVVGHLKHEAVISPRLVDAEPLVLNSESLALAEKHLAESIGPLAKVLVKRASKEANDLTELYQRLSEHVPAGAERTRFLKYGEQRHA